MLVLTRHAGEEIVIGKDARVTVVAVRGHKVRIGITAPSDRRAGSACGNSCLKRATARLRWVVDGRKPLANQVLNACVPSRHHNDMRRRAMAITPSSPANTVAQLPGSGKATLGSGTSLAFGTR